MKKGIKAGFVLMLFMAGTLTLSAQRYMGGMRMDTTRMHRMMMGRDQMMPGMRPDSMRMHPMWQGMQNGMWQCPMMQQGMHQGMGTMPWGRRGMQNGMGRSSEMMPWSMGRMWDGMGPGQWRTGRYLDNIPNLSDKQKKDIAVLRIDQQSEMKKFMDDMAAKMKTMREAHKAAIEKLLTPEQKKWLEENSPSPQSVPVKLDKSVPPLATPK